MRFFWYPLQVPPCVGSVAVLIREHAVVHEGPTRYDVHLLVQGSVSSLTFYTSYLTCMIPGSSAARKFL